ncbi:unnamed protein product [Mytilus coruscus]|uniref:DUF4218 domain-containing protein n=1 Tax=Mytilus coruscus TaxID=42192 RepID=A0A6J8CY34_MYTCO|nr:unnamed protein product [Mytilus coruscus]
MDMTKAFPVDYMHQTCLGVMKRLLLLWLRGKRDFKLSAQNNDQISFKLLQLRKAIPSVFARKPRSLDDADRWKATEYRQFLLYTGKIVLKDILRPELYSHFMALSIGIGIIVSPELSKNHQIYAGNLLKFFIAQGREIYGPEFLVYNVHSMMHIADDVKNHGHLDKFSAFPYENYMQKLKKTVHSGKCPLIQIIKRIFEMKNETQSFVDRQEKKIVNKKPNNSFILDNQDGCEVIEFTNEKHTDGSDLVLCRIHRRSEPIFIEPCDSRILGAMKCHRRHTVMKNIPISQLERRAIMIQKGMYSSMIKQKVDCHSSMIRHKDTYEKALARRKRAEYTSHVETDEEDEENRREAGRPDRFNSSEDGKKIWKITLKDFTEKICRPSTTSSSSHPTTPRTSSSHPTTPQASSSRPTAPQSSSSRPTTPQTNYPPTPPPYQPSSFRTNERRESRVLPDLPECELDTPRSSRGGEINETRLQRQGEENTAILKQLRAGQSNAVNDDAADIDCLLAETQALSILGSNTVGDTVRKMMRRLGNNSLWSLYSLKGKKEKEAFQTTAIYRVVVKASLKVHQKSTETEVNDAIIDFLKHAPHQPGSNKYKKSQPQQTPVHQGL